MPTSCTQVGVWDGLLSPQEASLICRENIVGSMNYKNPIKAEKIISENFLNIAITYV